MKKYTFPKSRPGKNTFACHRCRKHTDDVIIKSGTQLCGDCFEKKCDICGKEDNWYTWSIIFFIFHKLTPKRCVYCIDCLVKNVTSFVYTDKGYGCGLVILLNNETLCLKNQDYGYTIQLWRRLEKRFEGKEIPVITSIFESVDEKLKLVDTPSKLMKSQIEGNNQVILKIKERENEKNKEIKNSQSHWIINLIPQTLKNYTTKTVSILFWVTIFLIICLIWNIFKFFNEIVNFLRSLVPKPFKKEIPKPEKIIPSKKEVKCEKCEKVSPQHSEGEKSNRKNN